MNIFEKWSIILVNDNQLWVVEVWLVSATASQLLVIYNQQGISTSDRTQFEHLHDGWPECLRVSRFYYSKSVY